MNRPNAFDFMLRSSDLVQDDLMNYYRNVDYVVHYDEIHPKRSLSSRWPFVQLIAAWRAYVGRRQLQAALIRLESLSGHLLADIGITTSGSTATDRALIQASAAVETPPTFAALKFANAASQTAAAPAKIDIPFAASSNAGSHVTPGYGAIAA